MKVEYRREIKHNYLIIDSDGLIWHEYECQMLEENQIEGLLRFQVRQRDENYRFYYDITSRQPLARLLENRTISGDEIRQIMIGITGVLERIEPFLLSENYIMLEAEYIYVDSETFRIWLCLIPGLERDFIRDYGKLLEYLLGKVDHQDKESVVLAYGLYQETRKEHYGIEDILKLLYREEGKQRIIEAEQPEWSERSQQTPWPERSPRPLRSEQPDKEEMSGFYPKTHGKKGLWKRFREFLTLRLPKKQPEPVQVSWQELFSETRTENREEPVLQPDVLPQSDFKPSGQGTVLLTDISPKEEVHRLRALDSGETDILITYFPFIIGKQKNMTDFQLDHETVSRLHLRMDRNEGEFRITDLNSTNGTAVRGKLLENNESVSINPGDEIQIARYLYRFE